MTAENKVWIENHLHCSNEDDEGIMLTYVRQVEAVKYCTYRGVGSIVKAFLFCNNVCTYRPTLASTCVLWCTQSE